MADDDLTRFNDWMGRVLHGLEPAQRKQAALKLGQRLRRSNLQRIAKNVQPDGTAMEPKKARLDRRGRLREKAGGKMFQGLRQLKHWRIDADEKGVGITAASPVVDHAASVSQFGEVQTIGRRQRDRTPIRFRYPVRTLLGFGPEDEDLPVQIMGEMLDPGD
ncbi:phage virion morphogenesis protein [Novosphingobium sp. SL115]|uniref:phage virion morphogenesis protein n=1 Tax=Novosphingobium sp. SL115 TaxID=2995150 RepID=UPI002274F67D|nr:phage virion morphogenesis protein [Novosphingobium sp. SL115]MCY1672110.1 phage virion morphogenesis protein [Novosphingobium sp. SL115]